MSLIRKVARPMLAAIFVAQGTRHLLDPEPATAAAKPVTDRIAPALNKYAPNVPTDTRTLVVANAGVHVGAGLLLATGRFPRTASLALAASLVPTTLAGHAFWTAEDDEERAAQRIGFLKNVGLFGGLLISAADTEGKPGLAWRAAHAADDAGRTVRRARREARYATREARRSTRLASAALTDKLSR